MKDYTLSQLKELRDEWIKEGQEKGLFESARLIGEHLARLLPIDAEKSFPQSPKTIDLGDGVFVHYELIEKYLGAFIRAKLTTCELVCVTVGGKKGKEYISGKRVLF